MRPGLCATVYAPALRNYLYKPGTVAAKVKPMSAKNKRIKGTHQRASRHREELLQEARSLLAGGKVRESRAAEARANQVDQLVGALDSDLLAESQLEGEDPRGH
jgi:hypothetical protein